jgi:hypothetical protein
MIILLHLVSNVCVASNRILCLKSALMSHLSGIERISAFPPPLNIFPHLQFAADDGYVTFSVS